jgi:thymidylate synthase (FAD)
MKFTYPEVYLLAETKVSNHGIAGMIRALGGDGNAWVDNTAAPSGGELLVEVAGRLCYKSFEPGLNPNVSKVREGNDLYIKNILASKHGSVLEHATVTFAFINVSRVFTHEIVRHRAGTAFSQESLRYVRLDELSAWFPPGLDDPEDVGTSVEVTRGETANAEFESAFSGAERVYKNLVDLFKIETLKNFDLKKKLTSAFRRVAPIGLATNIVVTANHRAWRHIIEQRTSPHAEEEIRLVIGEVANILKRTYPNIYQDMEFRYTVDGSSWEFENSKV